MKYIFKFIEYINETNILSLATLILIIGYLRYLYNKKEEVEEYLGFKLVGFHMLGLFTFSFNFKYIKFVLPIGFIIYLLFMKNKERKNNIIKKKATVFGFIILCLGGINSIIYNKVEYRDRIIPMESIAINSLKGNYEILKKELDIDNQAFIEKFELDYNKNEIKMLSYTVKDINNNKYYYISNNTKSYNVYISKIYDYNEDDMLVFNPMEYNIDIEKFLDIINNVKFKENKDADYYIILYRNDLMSYEEIGNLYTIDFNDYSTKKLKSEYPIYDAAQFSHMPMKSTGKGSWESMESYTYLMDYKVYENNE